MVIVGKKIQKENKYDALIDKSKLKVLYLKDKVRSNDRNWFNVRLGKEYMKGKEIHHEWDNGRYCKLFGPFEHLIKDGRTTI